MKRKAVLIFLLSLFTPIMSFACISDIAGGDEKYEESIENSIVAHELELKRYEELDANAKKSHAKDIIQVNKDGTTTRVTPNGTRITSKYFVDSPFSEDIARIKLQIKEGKETHPISKYVDVRKYQQIYNSCSEKIVDKKPDIPCGSPYQIKECAHEAYKNSKI